MKKKITKNSLKRLIIILTSLILAPFILFFSYAIGIGFYMTEDYSMFLMKAPNQEKVGKLYSDYQLNGMYKPIKDGATKYFKDQKENGDIEYYYKDNVHIDKDGYYTWDRKVVSDDNLMSIFLMYPTNETTTISTSPLGKYKYSLNYKKGKDGYNKDFLNIYDVAKQRWMDAIPLDRGWWSILHHKYAIEWVDNDEKLLLIFENSDAWKQRYKLYEIDLKNKRVKVNRLAQLI